MRVDGFLGVGHTTPADGVLGALARKYYDGTLTTGDALRADPNWNPSDTVATFYADGDGAVDLELDVNGVGEDGAAVVTSYFVAFPRSARRRRH